MEYQQAFHLLIFMLFELYGIYGNELNFLAIGDWGGIPIFPYTTFIEKSVSEQMSKTAEETRPHFVVALGDNFYFDGVKNEYDKRFKATYDKIFDQDSLQVPWYPIAGNHDHHGNVSAQIAYSKHSKRWKYHDIWYSKKFLIPGSNSTLKLVLIDTVILCGNTGYDDELLQPEAPEDNRLAELQWSWLEVQLKHSKDQYVIVGGHFPVFSIAEHGPTSCLVDRLKPLLEKYKVTAYFCGHDHNLQHIHEDENDVHYFVIGSGNFIVDNQSNVNSIPHNSLQFYYAEKGGYSLVNVKENVMYVHIIDSDGKMLHRVALPPRNI